MSGGELEQLRGAEQKLLSALQAAEQVVELLSSGARQAQLEELCARFLADVQDSQVALLRLAERHQQPLPLQNNDYRARLQLLAARKQAAAAEAQAAASAQQ
ncbi:hypothetical protein COHA_010192 [Chlorella ohadii]|uniref:Mediator of RNA polymerase II transcription subunit 11 n=1 Tax=Chlorella ohadii TaxID=2649997 RepID=A0AAD5DFU5_9CHLO|nr:hypothetical protein COHA_010192 [Chlorella ohadii]